MIDNVILLITGTLHERDTNELLERCHPLGMFDSIAALCIATNVAELYNTVIVETPLGKFLSLFFFPYYYSKRGWSNELIYNHCTIPAPYFEKCLSANDLDELNIEIILNTLHKAYIEDFYGYCQSLGDPTADVMGEVLQVSL